MQLCSVALRAAGAYPVSNLSTMPFRDGMDMDMDHDHDHDHDHGDDDDCDHDHMGGHGGHNMRDVCEGLEGVYSVGLHVVGVFVILAASIVGTLVPLVGKHVPALRLPMYWYAVGKNISAGVMLGVSLIHMVGMASMYFDASCIPEDFQSAYPSWSPLFAMIAAVLMHAMDAVISEVLHDWANRRCACADPIEGADAGNGALLVNAAKDSSTDEKCPDDEAQMGKLEGSASPGEEACAMQCGAHQHPLAVAAGMDGVTESQRIVAALSMEFGLTLHSIFVGMDLGVTTDSSMKVLLISLVFHQMFEGVAIGTRLAEATFHVSMEIFFSLLFSVSAPVGAAIATAVVSSSRGALAGAPYVMTSAILNSMCGGILMYLGFGMLFVDFPTDMRRLCPAGTPYRSLKRMGLFLAVWAGAALMGVLCKWSCQ